MFILLPDEIIRKIICELNVNNFIMMININWYIKHMNLSKLLLPWRLEGYYGINYYVSIKERKDLYTDFINKINFIDMVNYITIEINKIMGDYTFYDHNFEIGKRFEKKLYKKLFNINPVKYNRYLKDNLTIKAVI